MSQQFSYSKVECFKKCPYQFGLRYLEKYKTLPNQDADNALILGVSLHYGMETGSVEKAIELYKSHYYCLSDLHIHEIMKLETMLSKALELFNYMGQVKHEVEIISDRYKGFVDLIEHNQDGSINVYDYKYCSTKSVDKYLESGQLHVYKYYLEKVLGYKVKSLYYIIIPKTAIRRKKTEDLYQFRQRLKEELLHKEVQLIEVPYNSNKVADYFNSIIDIYECKNFVKNATKLCDWCEYKDYCEKGEDYMLLPSTQRRNIEEVTKRVTWWYGAPFTGKTTTANDAPVPLMLNTDGNIKFVDAPFIPIKNKVEMNGRIKNETLAWDIFKDVLSELEKGQNDFKTIIVDLTEDVYEHCRIWGCNKLGIDHESDNSFKAYDYVRAEFLRTMSRLMNLDYENIILLSHEDISKDIMKKSGDKVTRIAPNINEKIANKLAGMVDIVGRVVAEGDERYLEFKTSEVIFGGGRLKGVKTTRIPLDWNEFVKIYDEVEKPKGSVEVPKEEPKSEDAPTEEAINRRSRRNITEEHTEERVAEEENVGNEMQGEEMKVSNEVAEQSAEATQPEIPVTRRRRRRTVEEA